MKVWIRASLGPTHSLRSPIDVSVLHTRERRNHRTPTRLRAIALTASSLAVRGDGESCLDDVDSEPSQLLCYLDFLFQVQRDTRRLLAVAQSRIEDPDYVGF